MNEEKEKIMEKKVEMLEKWFRVIQDLLVSQFEKEKCRFYLERLSEEFPVLISFFKDDSQNPSTHESDMNMSGEQT